MARKRTAKMPTAVEPVAPVTRPVRLDLTPEVHRLLRLVSAHADLSMAQFARHALEAAVREEAKRRGIKP